jgi:heme exporter protein A
MSAPTVSARGLAKIFDTRFALTAIDIDLFPGEVVALLGPNGAGKTTLLSILATVSRPSRGDLTLFGLPFARAAAEARGRIGVCAHATFLYGDLTAEENLRFYARLYGVPDGAAIGAALERFGLAARARDRVRTFSRGMQQRLALARTLLPGPEMLLLDEPTTGLDAAATSLLVEVLRAERDRGRLVLVATHDFGAAARLADRVIVLSRGRIALDGLGEPSAAALAARYAEAVG